MARARNIKPSFFINDKLADCEPLARLLFAGLWTIADREGRLEDAPRKIKAQALPYDDCDCEKLLNQLVKGGFILRYSIDNNQYIQIVKFAEHQNPHVKEGASTIPAPNLHQISTVQNVPLPDSPIPLIDSPILNPSKKKPAVLEMPDWLDLDLWRNFVEHRKFIKAPMSVQAAKVNLASLEKLISKGYSQAEIINLAIGNGWKGFYEPKGANNGIKQTNGQYHKPSQSEQIESAIARLGERYGIDPSQV